MNKKELLQTYLDRELPDSEVSAVESMIEQDPGTKELLENLQKQQKNVLKALAKLDPVEIPEPDLVLHLIMKSKFYRNLKIAAGILILVGLSALLWSIFNSTGKSAKEEKMAEVFKTEISNSQIDYYISPNRCWNQRQLVWTIRKIN